MKKTKKIKKIKVIKSKKSENNIIKRCNLKTLQFKEGDSYSIKQIETHKSNFVFINELIKVFGHRK